MKKVYKKDQNVIMEVVSLVVYFFPVLRKLAKITEATMLILEK